MLYVILCNNLRFNEFINKIINEVNSDIEKKEKPKPQLVIRI